MQTLLVTGAAGFIGFHTGAGLRSFFSLPASTTASAATRITRNDSPHLHRGLQATGLGSATRRREDDA